MDRQHFRQEDCLWLLVRVCEHFGVPFSACDAQRVSCTWPDAVSGDQLAGALATLGIEACCGDLPERACASAGRRAPRQAPYVAALRSEEVCPDTLAIIEELIPVLVVAADEASVSVTAAGDGAPLVLERASFMAMARAEVFTLSAARANQASRGSGRQHRRMAANDPWFVLAGAAGSVTHGAGLSA